MPDRNYTRPPPFSLRLSPEERRALEARAGNVPLGRYIRSQILDDRATHNVSAAILAKLGKSGVASSINKIARAIELGIIIVEPETEEAIRAAGRAVVEIKIMNMRALGIKED